MIPLERGSGRDPLLFLHVATSGHQIDVRVEVRTSTDVEFYSGNPSKDYVIDCSCSRSIDGPALRFTWVESTCRKADLFHLFACGLVRWVWYAVIGPLWHVGCTSLVVMASDHLNCGIFSNIEKNCLTLEDVAVDTTCDHESLWNFIDSGCPSCLHGLISWS